MAKKPNSETKHGGNRSSSSRKWLNEHFKDEFVLRSKVDGYRSRAVYKLDEIQQRDRLLKPGMTVVDLGAAPGGWSQYAGRLLGDKGLVVALDILPMEPLPNVEFIEGDFREEAVYTQLMEVIERYTDLENHGVDLVMSDMAPNVSGMKAVDQPRAMHLVELALELARTTLKVDGAFVVKVFQGEGFQEYIQELRGSFKRVVTRKPKASRPRSPEVYLLATGFKGE